jgi:hypothetical protein
VVISPQAGFCMGAISVSWHVVLPESPERDIRSRGIEAHSPAAGLPTEVCAHRDARRATRDSRVTRVTRVTSLKL